MIADVVSNGDEVTSPVATGQLDIAPKILQDPGQVRLAAAVESADPYRGLLLLVQVSEEAFEDSLDATRVLAVADEAAQLPTQHAPLLLGLRLPDLSDAIVRDRRSRGIAVE